MLCEIRWPSIDLVLKLTVSAYYVRVLPCFKGGQAEHVKHLFGRTNRCMVSARLLVDKNVIGSDTRRKPVCTLVAHWTWTWPTSGSERMPLKWLNEIAPPNQRERWRAVSTRLQFVPKTSNWKSNRQLSKYHVRRRAHTIHIPADSCYTVHNH